MSAQKNFMPLKQDKLSQLVFSLGLGSLSFLFFSAPSTFFFPLIFLGYFAQLPLFVLGFTAGYGEVLIAGAFGTFLNFFFSGETQLVSYALFYVSPPVFLAYLLDFRKKENSILQREGSIEAFLAQGIIFVGIFLMMLSFLIFENPEVQALSRKSILHFLGTFSQSNRTALFSLLEEVIHYFPALMSISWIIMTFGNGALAQLLSKRLKRKLPYLLQIKNWSVFQWQYWLLAGALAGSIFLNKPEAFLMQNLVLVALVPFLIEGLAVFHEVYSKITSFSWGIIVFYGLIFILGWPILALVFLGVFEPWVHVRQRFADRKSYYIKKEK